MTDTPAIPDTTTRPALPDHLSIDPRSPHHVAAVFQHDIGIHVIHHLFPQIPHYNLVKATDALKPVMGDYYREPEASPGPLPTHLIAPLVRSFGKDHYVADEGNIVFYQKSPEIEWKKVFFGKKEAQQA